MKLKQHVINHVRQRKQLPLRNQIQMLLGISERSLQRKLQTNDDDLTKLPVLNAIADNLNVTIGDLVSDGKADFVEYIKSKVDDFAFENICIHLKAENIEIAHDLLNEPELLTLPQIEVIVHHVNSFLNSDEFITAYKLFSEYNAGKKTLNHKEIEIMCKEYEYLNAEE